MGAGCRHQLVGTTLTSVSSCSLQEGAADHWMFAHAAWPGAGRSQASTYQSWHFCNSIHSTYRLQSYCDASTNQNALSWQHSSQIFGPKQAFRVNHIIVTCFPHIFYYTIIITLSIQCYYSTTTYYYCNNDYTSGCIITYYHISYYAIPTHYICY